MRLNIPGILLSFLLLTMPVFGHPHGDRLYRREVVVENVPLPNLLPWHWGTHRFAQRTRVRYVPVESPQAMPNAQPPIPSSRPPSCPDGQCPVEIQYGWVLPTVGGY